MNRIEVLFKPGTALLLVALLTGCGSGGEGGASLGSDPAGPPTAAGLGTGVGGGRGPAPVTL